MKGIVELLGTWSVVTCGQNIKSPELNQQNKKTVYSVRALMKEKRIDQHSIPCAYG